MITLSTVRKDYSSEVRIGPVDLDIPVGGITALIGPNGAGKSTLLTMIGRLQGLDEGVIEVAGLDVTRTASKDLAKVLSILRQENHFITRLTIRQLVGFGRFPYSRGRLTAHDEEIISRSIEFLDLQDLEDRFLDELSGGQRQRAYVAMVLAQDTDYLLLDEPLNNLDMKHAAHTMQLLRRAADELQKTVVVVLHDINFASAYADHIVAMKDGVVVATGGPHQIMHRELLRDVFDMDIVVQDMHGMRLGVFWTPGAPVPRRPAPTVPVAHPFPTRADPRGDQLTSSQDSTYRHDALVSTDRPRRWAKQLASHLGRKMEVEETDRGPLLLMTFEGGPARCLLDTSTPDRLGLHVEAATAEAAGRMQHVVGGHLERFGAKEGLAVGWS